MYARLVHNQSIFNTYLADGSKDRFNFKKHVACIVVIVSVEVGKVTEVSHGHHPTECQAKILANLNKSGLF